MSSVVLSGDKSGTVTVTVPSVAGTNTVTIPAVTGTVMVSGNMPTFSYYETTTATSLGNVSFTKITFDANEWDTTGGMVASSRFTPTIAGYYQISGGYNTGAATGQFFVTIYKNGSSFKRGSMVAGGISGLNTSVSALVYCNGSTDYVELYGYQNSGSSVNTALGNSLTYFQGVLVRTA